MTAADGPVDPKASPGALDGATNEAEGRPPGGANLEPAGETMSVVGASTTPRSGGVGPFAFVGALISALTILGTVIRSKVTAQVVGPSGLGVFAEAQQVFSLAMTVATVAVGPALVTRLARELRDGRQSEAGETLGASLRFGSLLGSFAVIAAWIMYPFIVSASARRPSSELFCLGLASFLGIIGAAYSALFTAQASVRRIAIQTGITALAATVFHVTFVVTLGVKGQFLAPLAASLTACASAVWLARSGGIRVKLVWDAAFAREAFRVGAASLIAGAFMQASLTAVRITLDRVGGSEQGVFLNGQYQAALTIGSRYFVVVTSGLGLYFFPRYAAAKTPSELEAEIWGAGDFVLRMAPPVVLALLALREPVIHLLYTTRFNGAAGILGYQLAGDMAKGISWVYSGPLLYRGAVRAYLVTEALAALLLTTLSIFCIHRFGLVGSGMAYAATYLIYMLIAAAVTVRSQKVRPRARHLWIGALGTIGAVASEVLRHHFARMDVVLLVIAAIWAWRGGLFAKGLKAALRAWDLLAGISP